MIGVRKPGRNIFRLFAGIAACANLSVADSLAQSLPNKPIRLYLGFSVGSAPDAVARLLAPMLSENLGQPLVVDNRVGAGGSIATETVAKSAADGHTLLLLAAADTLQPALRAKLPYDLERDFAPVSMVAIGTAVLAIHPLVPARSVKELMALARSNPGKLSYGSSGAGSSSHLMGELFNSMAKVNIAHVPYKGSADSAIATAAGQIEMSFPSVVALLPLQEAGKLRALAVTSAKRASLLPSIPTLDESGLTGYDRTTWWGVVAPTGVSRDSITRLNAVIGKVVNMPGTKASIIRQGLEPQTNSPEQFAAFIHGEIAQNARLIRLSGAKTD
jgi:tripartite-type tricarboxylate transporter receptor subunit TctC